jgi:hypothetical protein
LWWCSPVFAEAEKLDHSQRRLWIEGYTVQEVGEPNDWNGLLAPADSVTLDSKQCRELAVSVKTPQFLNLIETFIIVRSRVAGKTVWHTRNIA